MKINNLKDFYIDQLEDLYSAETQVIDALPAMVEAASSSELRDMLRGHLDESKRQRKRLERVMQAVGVQHNGKVCEGMQGILRENEDVMGNDVDPRVRDAALITDMQKIEHYEIATYGSVCSFAETFGDEENARILRENLDEEKDADRELTSLAERSVNASAMHW